MFFQFVPRFQTGKKEQVSPGKRAEPAYGQKLQTWYGSKVGQGE